MSVLTTFIVKKKQHKPEPNRNLEKTNRNRTVSSDNPSDVRLLGLNVTFCACPQSLFCEGRGSLVYWKGRNPEKGVQLSYVNLSNTNPNTDSNPCFFLSNVRPRNWKKRSPFSHENVNGRHAWPGTGSQFDLGSIISTKTRPRLVCTLTIMMLIWLLKSDKVLNGS